ncbi:hypothetical protein AYO49_02450 [Verrucomicrobiaceae bacterium SCGC AG-212-N21]|nr:hypothetical protein AYO49_02450 [Verrucomicrobiaceae bacterium SCGC AG-212-N21]
MVDAMAADFAVVVAAVAEDFAANAVMAAAAAAVDSGVIGAMARREGIANQVTDLLASATANAAMIAAGPVETDVTVTAVDSVDAMIVIAVRALSLHRKCRG